MSARRLPRFACGAGVVLETFVLFAGCGGSNDIVLNPPEAGRDHAGASAGFTASGGTSSAGGGGKVSNASGGAPSNSAGSDADPSGGTGNSASGGAQGGTAGFGAAPAAGAPATGDAGADTGAAGACDPGLRDCTLGCRSDRDCAARDDAPHCDLARAVCVECLVDAQCESGKRCDAVELTCVDCVNDTDCRRAAP